jgi:hypothetical protein
MGASIFPLSGYSGSQYDISILIWKVSKQFNLVQSEIVSQACRPENLCPLAAVLFTLAP